MQLEQYVRDVIYQTPCLTTFPNVDKRVENTTRSAVFFTNFDVFGNVVKHCVSL